jgi:hypothetical protein
VEKRIYHLRISTKEIKEQKILGMVENQIEEYQKMRLKKK